MITAIERLTQRLGYRFTRPDLLGLALTHCSAGAENNERFEFLGDALLGFVIAEALFVQHEQANEGQLSRLRAGLVKQETLAALAKDLNLGGCLNLGAGEMRSGGATRDSILADAMEAVFAAVYLDGGMDALRSLVLRLYADKLHNTSIECSIKDPKTRLQELLQSRGMALPEYSILDTKGAPHEQSFCVCCKVAKYSLTTEGNSTSRRRAEQQAAQLMLEQIATPSSCPMPLT